MDLEARAHEDHHDALRLWLRLLTCTQLIEQQVRARLREQFETTLPRFDLMAQLERSPNGMILGELSQRMMVSNGNITGLVRLLGEHGLVATFTNPTDRRATYVRLTAAGRANFADMAAAHAGWVADMFADLDADAMGRLMDGLGRLKRSVMQGERNDV